MLIFLRSMSDVGVKILFEKDICKMVLGEMVLLRGVMIGTLYKLLGSTISDACSNSIVSESGVEERKTRCGIKGYYISERRAFDYYTVMVL